MSSPTPDTSDRLIDVGLVSLAAMRIGIGGLAWVNPDLTATLFGFSRPDAQSRYLWRLFGVRDVMIGLGTGAPRARGGGCGRVSAWPATSLTAERVRWAAGTSRRSARRR